MTSKSKLTKATILTYATVSLLFLAFFIYMALFEHVSVYSERESRTYTLIEDYSVEEIQDSKAPVGIRKEYRFTLEQIGTNENSLGFYLVHHYAEVYFDDELVYRLTKSGNNYLSDSVSSNWIIIPIYPEDSGKEVRVVVTPVYKSVVNREIEFQLGSHLMIYVNQLKKDLPQIVSAALCILIGLFIMTIQLILILMRKSRIWDMFYLGNFTLLLGIWKIVDTRFSSLLFPGNTLVLGYIAIGVLFLCPIPFLLFLKEWLQNTKTTLLLTVALTFSGVSLCALLCQVFGIAELRETLVLSHIMIVITVLLGLMLSFSRRWKQKDRIPKNALKLIMILVLMAGAVFDLIKFYISGTSSGIVYTIAAFLLCTVILFVTNLLDINKRGYTDAQTGLFNRSRWDRLVGVKAPVAATVGLIMLDLNRLKYTNDTMGHEAGDRMIYNFSNILRNSISHSNTICRWGGDEFAVMVMDADRKKMEACLLEIAQATEAYNASGAKPEIHYAAGYALSSEFPKHTLEELLRVADKRMYLNKKQWYDNLKQ